MRIRKNAKLSPLLFSPSMASVPQVLQTHVCQLNQSPWDVIPLHQDATNQLLEEAEYSGAGNGSLGDYSIGAVESVASMMEESAKLSNNIVIIDENEVMAEKDGDFGDENGVGLEKLVAGDDDWSWKCKNQPKEEDYSSFRSDHRHHHHHRRSFLRSSENTLNNCSITEKAAAGTRRTRPARASKKAAAASGGSNPYEFYYYSGFGPLWGKKRRERGGEEGERSVENTTGFRSNATTPSPPPSEIDGDELDYVDDDDDDDDGGGGGDGGKKRMRKPVKARSLKSLM